MNLSIDQVGRGSCRALASPQITAPQERRTARFASGAFLALTAWFCLIAAATNAAPASLASTNSPSTTNGMLIVCDDGVIFSNSIPLLVFTRNVRVLDRQSDTYMECDRLTLTFQTNATRLARTNKAPVLDASGLAGIAGSTNANTRLDTILAEGRVLIVTKDQQVLGDRAVYLATNDVMIVTGEQVILASEQGVGLGTRAVFDRGNGVFRGEGPFSFDGLAKSGTNGFGLSPGRAFPGRNTNSPAKKPAPTATPPRK
jgi:hypothetical protein